MTTFSYRPEGDNAGLVTKTSTEAPSFTIDFAGGLGASVAMSSASVAGVDSDNVASTTIVNGGISILSTIVTVKLLTGGAGGTAAAANGARFRVRATVTCNDSRVLVYDTHVLIQDPSYNPD